MAALDHSDGTTHDPRAAVEDEHEEEEEDREYGRQTVSTTVHGEKEEGVKERKEVEGEGGRRRELGRGSRRGSRGEGGRGRGTSTGSERLPKTEHVRISKKKNERGEGGGGRPEETRPLQFSARVPACLYVCVCVPVCVSCRGSRLHDIIVVKKGCNMFPILFPAMVEIDTRSC